MALRESAVERYTFRCQHCEREWTRDYEVTHVTEPDGYTRQYYSLNGLPVAAPSAPRAVACPACGAEHPHTSFVARSATQEDEPSVSPPAKGTQAGTAPAKLAREASRAIDALLAAAKEPGGPGISHVGDVKEIVSALRNGLISLPQLLDELGTCLDHVEERPHPRHAGDLPRANRSLHRAADNAKDLTGPLVEELARVRAALVTLESLPVHPQREARDRTA